MDDSAVPGRDIYLTSEWLMIHDFWEKRALSKAMVSEKGGISSCREH